MRGTRRCSRSPEPTSISSSFTSTTSARRPTACGSRTSSATAIDAIHALGGTQSFAVTEFGTLYDGDTQLNALISADFVRVAAERGVLANLRHILIEDQPSGLFATSAAILGDTHLQTPGYYAMASLAEALQPVAVGVELAGGRRSRCSRPATMRRTRSASRSSIAASSKRRSSSRCRCRRAHWTRYADDRVGRLADVAGCHRRPASTSTRMATIAFTLPANGLAVFRLTGD